MRQGLIGMIATPAAGNAVVSGVDWCADNAAFTGGYPGDEAYLAWLYHRRQYADRCSFAVAPDVPFDAAGTLARSAPMFGRVRALGYPVALAAQNGQEDLPVPWSYFDVLFLAGDTEWKLGPYARELVRLARRYGKWVHMGRVNSEQRLRYAQAIGCHSADGTFLAFGPDKNLPQLLAWLRLVNDQYGLWEISA